ncbi:unnamed protein product [Phytomonas sp. EM1]|nr:unnamed protein product [Phytomonas sp. EM1]|eukprot:CCW61802.1 unnamed protein product [Phytomonas sp. isolate EM1]
MSFLFVSNLPKEESTESIQSFLEDSFPLSTSIRILRDGQGHNGHAYVHFAHEKAAQAAAQLYTVACNGGSGNDRVKALKYRDGDTELRLRVCEASEGWNSEHPGGAARSSPSLEPLSAPNFLIEALEGMPLPPHCAELVSYKCCRYILAPPCDDEKNSAEVENSQRPLTMRRIATLEEDLFPAKVCVAVVGDTESDKVGEGGPSDASVARCGPPSLTALLGPARGLREHLRLSERWNVEDDRPRKRGREADREVGLIVNGGEGFSKGARSLPQQHLESDLGVKCMQGCSWLSPSEALDELRSFFSGEGLVAVKDKFGTIAVMNLPTYVASLE